MLSTKALRKLYHKFIPFYIQEKIDFKRRAKWFKLSRVVEKYYKNKDNTPEIRESLSFLHKHHFNLNSTRLLYLSNITDYYLSQYSNIPVLYDHSIDLPYIYHNGKPLYYPQYMDATSIRTNYAQFLSEMDNRSPHLYCKNTSELKNRILFDCGVAEGLFPLTYVDIFEKIVLFECNPNWIKPLKATFKPYQDKVIIANLFVSDEISTNQTTLDHFAISNNIKPTFLKMDIEGYEERAIDGASNLLRNSNDLICSICTYHTPTAETNILDKMKSNGYYPSYNHGYMFFFYEEKIEPPYLRRGVIRFYKEKQ